MLSRLSIDILIDYMGSGWLVLVFLAAFVYLFITEKKKQFRVILVWSTLVMILLFLFPLTKIFFAKATDAATYYRFLWMIPMGITIAYASARAFLDHRIIGILVSGGIVILCGTYVYHGQYMYAAENVYHLPQEMMEICDQLPQDEKYGTIVCFPAEYIQQVRQYNSNIIMPFSREELVGGWTLGNEIFELSQAERVDVKALTNACREHMVEFYVFNKDKERDGAFEDLGWELYYESEHYCVYRDTVMGSIWERAVEWLSNMSEADRNAWLESQGFTIEDYEQQLELNQKQ